MELLWSFTGEAAPQGDIGKKKDADIAVAVGWERPQARRSPLAGSTSNEQHRLM